MTQRQLPALTILLALIGCLGFVADCFAQENRSLRILSYNVHHCRGLDEKIDLPRIAEIIKGCQPDFVALQEIDNKTRRCGGVDQAAELGRLTSMQATFFKAIDFEGGQYGQAILSKLEAKGSRTLTLPNLPGREQRIVGIANFELAGVKLQFCTVHLDHAHDALRLEQAEKINEHFSSDGTWSILAGDFNATLESKVMQTIEGQWKLAAGSNSLPTFPAEDPKKQIDFIVFRPNIKMKAESVKVLDQPMASDHRPIFAELQMQVGR